MAVQEVSAVAGELADVYRDLHANPELAFQETRTAGIAADWLAAQGFEVTTGVGVTGVVGVLRNGPGPTVLLRADMDGLPVEEATGLAYASLARGRTADGADVPVMHACGHDMHVTCLHGCVPDPWGRRARRGPAPSWSSSSPPRRRARAPRR